VVVLCKEGGRHPLLGRPLDPESLLRKALNTKIRIATVNRDVARDARWRELSLAIFPSFFIQTSLHHNNCPRLPVTLPLPTPLNEIASLGQFAASHKTQSTWNRQAEWRAGDRRQKTDENRLIWLLWRRNLPGSRVLLAQVEKPPKLCRFKKTASKFSP